MPHGEQPDQPLAARIKAGEGAPGRGALLPVVDDAVQLAADAVQPQRRLGRRPLVERMTGFVPFGGVIAAGVPLGPFGSQVKGLPGDGVERHAREGQPPPEHPRRERVLPRIARPGPERVRPPAREEPSLRGLAEQALRHRDGRITGRAGQRVRRRPDAGVVGDYGERGSRSARGQPALGAGDLPEIQALATEVRRQRQL